MKNKNTRETVCEEEDSQKPYEMRGKNIYIFETFTTKPLSTYTHRILSLRAKLFFDPPLLGSGSTCKEFLAISASRLLLNGTSNFLCIKLRNIITVFKTEDQYEV